MHTDDRTDPAGGAAGAGEPADRLVEDRGIGLQAAPLFGLEQFEETDLVEFVDGFVGHLAPIFGGLGPFPQLRQQIIDAGEDRLHVTLFNGRH